jgi:hypothetical protein
MLALRLVMRPQMERGFATRPLQHGPALVERAQQTLRGPVVLQHGHVLVDRASRMLAVRLKRGLTKAKASASFLRQPNAVILMSC